MLRTTMVVPCYNEAQRLDGRAFLDFISRETHVDFVLVDDGSRDQTLQVLTELCRAAPERIHVLPLPRNQGKAEAVRTGLMAALDRGADCVGFVDADLAAPLEEIPRLIDVLSRRPDVHVVVGSRLPILGHAIRRRAVRRILSRCFAAVAARVLGLPICDTQCGLKLFRAGPATRALLDEPFQSRWIFDVEILARLIARDGREAARAQVYEAPLERWTEIPGSKLKRGDFAKAIGELARIYRTYLRQVPASPTSVPPASSREAGRLGGERSAAPATRRAA